MSLFPLSPDPVQDAAVTAAQLEEHAASAHLWYDVSPAHRTRQVLHLITFGAHVDPDLGREYVSVGERLTSDRRRKISERNDKVEVLRKAALERLLAGDAPAVVQKDIHSRQQFRAVALSTSPEELQEILVEAFSAGDLCPGSLDGGYVNEIDDRTLLFTWEEAIACEGGVTDRYWFAQEFGDPPNITPQRSGPAATPPGSRSYQGLARGPVR